MYVQCGCMFMCVFGCVLGCGDGYKNVVCTPSIRNVYISEQQLQASSMWVLYMYSLDACVWMCVQCGCVHVCVLIRCVFGWLCVRMLCVWMGTVVV